MNKVILLVNPGSEFQFNNTTILTNALIRNGFSTYLGLSDSVYLEDKQVVCMGKRETKELTVGKEHDNSDYSKVTLADFQYVWVLSFGKRNAFLDYLQMLWVLKEKVKFINSIDALLFLNNKHALSFFSTVFKYPITYISSDPEYLERIFNNSPSTTWVLKPPAESLGRNVFLLRKGDSNSKVILQNMANTKNGKYAMLQQYIPQIKENGEKRVIVANGEVVCQYLRKSKGDHRTNIHQGAEAKACDLSKQEQTLCNKVGSFFLNYGVKFIGLDLVFPYILELNITNPGGLNTLYELSGIDYSDEVVKNLFRYS